MRVMLRNFAALGRRYVHVQFLLPVVSSAVLRSQACWVGNHVDEVNSLFRPFPDCV